MLIAPFNVRFLLLGIGDVLHMSIHARERTANRVIDCARMQSNSKAQPSFDAT